MKYKIKPKIENGDVHWEVHKDGKFYCSETTYNEAQQTIEELKLLDKT